MAGRLLFFGNRNQFTKNPDYGEFADFNINEASPRTGVRRTQWKLSLSCCQRAEARFEGPSVKTRSGD